jgi:predicted nucleic acid-binding protein
MERAAALAREHGLRAADAIHLASSTLNDQLIVVSSDHDLLDAARTEGSATLDPEAAEAMKALAAYRRGSGLS